MNVEVVDQEADFDALQPEWDAAAGTTTDPNIFLTWEWLRTWWRHFGEPSRRAQLHLVTFRDADGLLGVAPLFREQSRIGPLDARVLRPISFDAGDYGGVLLGRRAEEVVDELLTHLTAQIQHGGVHLVALSRLTSDSRFLDLLRPRLGDPGQLGASVVVADDPLCPYVEVTDDYDLGKRRRKVRVDQHMAKLRANHQVTFEHHTGPTLESGIAALLDVHRRRWAGRTDAETGMLARPDTQAFLLDALRVLDARGWLRLVSLRADDRAIAIRLDLESRGRNYMLKHAIDPDFTEFAPGHLLHHHVVEDGIARGVREFDFLRGDDEYKRRWTNRERHLVAVTLSRSGRAGSLARQRVRLARRLSRRH